MSVAPDVSPSQKPAEATVEQMKEKAQAQMKAAGVTAVNGHGENGHKGDNGAEEVDGRDNGSSGSSDAGEREGHEVNAMVNGGRHEHHQTHSVSTSNGPYTGPDRKQIGCKFYQENRCMHKDARDCPFSHSIPYVDRATSEAAPPHPLSDSTTAAAAAPSAGAYAPPHPSGYGPPAHFQHHQQPYYPSSPEAYYHYPGGYGYPAPQGPSPTSPQSAAPYNYYAAPQGYPGYGPPPPPAAAGAYGGYPGYYAPPPPQPMAYPPQGYGVYSPPAGPQQPQQQGPNTSGSQGVFGQQQPPVAEDRAQQPYSQEYAQAYPPAPYPPAQEPQQLVASESAPTAPVAAPVAAPDSAEPTHERRTSLPHVPAPQPQPPQPQPPIQQPHAYFQSSAAGTAPMTSQTAVATISAPVAMPTQIQPPPFPPATAGRGRGGMPGFGPGGVRGGRGGPFAGRGGMGGVGRGCPAGMRPRYATHDGAPMSASSGPGEDDPTRGPRGPCSFFARSLCRYGDTCAYAHVMDNGDDAREYKQDFRGPQGPLATGESGPSRKWPKQEDFVPRRDVPGYAIWMERVKNKEREAKMQMQMQQQMAAAAAEAGGVPPTSAELGPQGGQGGAAAPFAKAHRQRGPDEPTEMRHRVEEIVQQHRDGSFPVGRGRGSGHHQRPAMEGAAAAAARVHSGVRGAAQLPQKVPSAGDFPALSPMPRMPSPARDETTTIYSAAVEETRPQLQPQLSVSVTPQSSQSAAVSTESSPTPVVQAHQVRLVGTFASAAARALSAPPAGASTKSAVTKASGLHGMRKSDWAGEMVETSAPLAAAAPVAQVAS